jgi:hypothetical protein
MLNKLRIFALDMLGVIRTPGTTLGKRMEEKRWLGPFLLLVIFVFILTYLTYPIQMQKFSEAVKLTGYISEDQVSQYFNTSVFSRFMFSMFPAFLLSLNLVFGAFFIYLFYGIGGTEGIYVNYFSITAGASIIDILIPSLISIVSLLTGLQTSILEKPGLIFLHGKTGSLLYLSISQLDIFAIWYIAAVALGIKVYSGISIKKSAAIGILYFLFKTVIQVAFGYIAFQLFAKGITNFPT